MDQTVRVEESGLGGDFLHGGEFLESDNDRIDIALFHNELRERMPVLSWTLFLFNPVFLGWSVFDYILVPGDWAFFLKLRFSAVILCTVVAVLASRPAFRLFTWEALWIIAFIQCGFLSLMLPLVGGVNLSRYVMGYILVILAAGIFPTWPLKWVMSVICVSLGVTGTVFFALWDRNAIPIPDVVSNSFVIATASAVSVLMAAYRYGFAKTDYQRRVQLAEIARRESEARLDLAKTSDDLQIALERLEELDRLKSKFFANISHELRTPLTLILAPVDELASIVTSTHELQQLRVIRRNAERLLRLINDLLDLSRLDAGGLRLNLAELDIRSIVTAVHENSAPAAAARSIEFNIRLDEPQDRIWGDAHRLEIVITNLVSNAIKFAPDGGWVEVRVDEIPGGVQVQVSDNGRGVALDDLPRVFERFFQVSPGDRRREGGVGIGLALAKELVEIHGGDISVASEPGEKTTFTVALKYGREHIRPEVVERRTQFEEQPARLRRAEDEARSGGEDRAISVREESESPESRVPGFDLGGGKPSILLVEDHKDVRDFIATLLDSFADVRLAENGLVALNLVIEEPPDLVISDVMMPEMDGTELCRALKSDPRFRNIPVILLTARVSSEATLDAYAHGADDFVAKPFHPKVLMARIRAQLRLRFLSLQMVQQEKLAVVGTLAAGILHEVRNPLNAILNASRVLSTQNTDEKLQEDLISVIFDGAERINDIASALDSHARPADSGAKQQCDVRVGLDSTLRILNHRLDGIQVHQEYLSDRFAIAPAGPLNQVFLNLLDNALKAGADTVWIRVNESDGRLRVAIADNGPGVSPDVASRIFDAFFTDRTDGSGTGLGLYLSKKILTEHHGTIEYRDRDGGGAEFVVEVPTIGSQTENGISGRSSGTREIPN